jgi:hypothetical protein
VVHSFVSTVVQMQMQMAEVCVCVCVCVYTDELGISFESSSGRSYIQDAMQMWDVWPQNVA